MPRILLSALFGLCLALAGPHPAQSEDAGKPLDILVLSSWFEGMPWQAGFEAGFRRGLTETGRPFRLFIEHLDASRFPNSKQRPIVSRLLREKYADRNIDVIVAESVPAVQLLGDSPELLPDARRLFVQTGSEVAPELRGQAIVAHVDYHEGFQEILRIASPKTVYVVGDVSNRPGQSRIEQFRASVPQDTGAVRVEYLTDLPAAVVYERISQLPEGSAIFMLPFFVGPEGNRVTPKAAAGFIASSANAPVFTAWDTLMGSGVVGGFLQSSALLGRMAAQRVSGAEAPTVTPSGYFYDWRQLKRWDIDQSLVPADAALMFYEPTVFERYRKELLAALVLFAVLVVLVAVLARQNRLQAQLRRVMARSNAELEEAVAARTVEVESRRAQVALLLDSSGQGFFSFGADLVVDGDASRACETFFGRKPDGSNAADLLFAGDPETAGLLREVIESVFTDGDPDRQEMMLSLLPKRVEIHNFVLNLDVQVIGDGKAMAVLTDVTEEAALSKKIADERKRTEMILSAVVDRRDFFLAVQDFRDFLVEAESVPRHGTSAPRAIDTVFRRAHTAKGVLGQFGFPSTHAALHAAETGLARARQAIESEAAAEARVRLADDALRGLNVRELSDAFEADLAVVRDALGARYVDEGGDTPIPPAMARALAELADWLLQRRQVDLDDRAVVNLLSETSRLTKVSLKSVLVGYDRLVQQLAARMEKEVEPVTATGGDVWIDIDQYGPFLRALVHVFRNCVAHGIEAPEDRENLGKPVAGRVTCTLGLDGSTIRVKIEDDGRGIDPDHLRARLGKRADARCDEGTLMAIFEDGFSTSAEADEVSGRGVGLPAVKASIEALGGSVRVRSTVGAGTALEIDVPASGQRAA